MIRMRRNSPLICLAILLAFHLTLLQQFYSIGAVEDNAIETPSTNSTQPPAQANITIKDSTPDGYNFATRTPPGRKVKLSNATTPATKPSNCPAECTCSTTEQRVTCEGRKLRTVPNLSKLTNVTIVNLGNNSIDDVDLNKLPLASLEELDLSSNLVKNFVGITPKTNAPKLKRLNLRANRIETLDEFAKLKLPVLEYLDLSINPLTAINGSTFNNTKNLRRLKLRETKVTRLDEFAFAPLAELQDLDMSFMQLANIRIGPSLFSNNRKLTTINLNNNSLPEVPTFLRSTTSIQGMMLNENLMTSLRQSDFINAMSLSYLEIKRCPKLNSIQAMTFSEMQSLKEIVLADNPRLEFISSQAFASEGSVTITLNKLDLSNNNISRLDNLNEFPSLKLHSVNLSNNPWNCGCHLQWMTQKSENHTLVMSTQHCNAPAEYKDMEIGFYLAHGCEPKSASYTLHLVLFLLLLVCLAVAAVAHKNDLFRRFLWRDQYGTIYYTKASFPPEQALLQVEDHQRGDEHHHHHHHHHPP